MAACVVSVGGTSGNVLIKYTLGSEITTIVPFGEDIFIDDAATDITYTTLSGDATASSGCLTITDLPAVCYSMEWESTGNASTYYFEAVILGVDEITFDDVEFDLRSLEDLASAINNAGDDRVKAVAGWTDEDIARLGAFHYINLRIIGEDVPYLRIRNDGTSFYLYIKGVSTSCTPGVDYTTYEICDPVPPAP
jgi:hypothetical protein